MSSRQELFGEHPCSRLDPCLLSVEGWRRHYPQTPRPPWGCCGRHFDYNKFHCAAGYKGSGRTKWLRLLPSICLGAGFRWPTDMSSLPATTLNCKSHSHSHCCQHSRSLLQSMQSVGKATLAYHKVKRTGSQAQPFPEQEFYLSFSLWFWRHQFPDCYFRTLGDKAQTASVRVELASTAPS